MVGDDRAVNRRRARRKQRGRDRRAGRAAVRGKRNDRERKRGDRDSAGDLQCSRTVGDDGRPEQRCGDCRERCNDARGRARRIVRRARVEPSYGMFGQSAGFG
jgi:hypothetical protein